MSNSVNKSFDLIAAFNLFKSYSQKRQRAKANFIAELIGCQIFVGSKSIVTYEVRVTKRYHKRTVTAVLDDMNYKIVSFHYQSNYSLADNRKHTYTIITFTPAEGY